MNAMVMATLPYVLKSMTRLGTSEVPPALDVDALNAALAGLPYTPDEKLR